MPPSKTKPDSKQPPRRAKAATQPQPRESREPRKARRARKPRTPRKHAEPVNAAPPAPSTPVRRFGAGHCGYGPNRSKIRELLTETDLRDLDELIERPGQTVEKVIAWVQARGYPIGESAVRKYMRQFRRRLEEARRAAEVAHQFALRARHSGVTFADGIIGAMQQLLMEHLVRTGEAMNIDPRDLPGLIKAVEVAVRTGRRVRDRDTDPTGPTHAARVVASRVVEPIDPNRTITVAERDAALESVVDRVNEYLLGVDEQHAAAASVLPEPPPPPSPSASVPPLPEGEGRGEGERREPSFLEGPGQGTAEIAESAEGAAEESPQIDTDSHG